MLVSEEFCLAVCCIDQSRVRRLRLNAGKRSVWGEKEAEHV